MTARYSAPELPWLAALYAAASLTHFVHNAEFLADYPNLPASLSRSWVYSTWLCMTAVGLVGYELFRRGRTLPGLLILAAYAACGFDGLLHYARAPIGAHTPTMNLTIWFEAIAAFALLIVVLLRTARYLRMQSAANHRKVV